jgi:hypothetical protein
MPPGLILIGWTFHRSPKVNRLEEHPKKSRIFSVETRTMKTLAIASCLLFLSNCTEVVVEPKNTRPVLTATHPVEQGTVARKNWERIYFKEISERIDGSDIKNLREQEMPPASKEVRVWVGFDLSPLKGIILKQTNGDWSARYVPPLGNSSNSPRASRPLTSPRTGWKSLWAKLESSGIYTLPDAADIGANNPYPEARGVVVEIKTADSYRTYKYGGLHPAETQEVKNVVEIVNTLSDEFGVQLN